MTDYVYLGLLIITMVLYYFSYIQYKKTKNLIDNGIRTNATVIELIKQKRRKRDYYTPVFEYTDKNENIITYKSNITTSPPAYRLGETVEFLYSENSDEKRVVSYWGLYRWTILLLCFATPMFIIVVGYFLYSKN